MFSSTSAGSSRQHQQQHHQHHQRRQQRDPSPTIQHRRLSHPSSNNHLDEDSHSTQTTHHARHPTFLEPPFSYPDHRPSSPRHHSTARRPSNPPSTPSRKPPTPTTPASAARTTLQLPDDTIPALWPDDEANDEHDIVLPSLRPPVESLAGAVGWPAEALDHFYSTSSDGIHHQLSDFATQEFSSPSTYPRLTSTSHVPHHDLEASQTFVPRHPASRCPGLQPHSSASAPRFLASASTSNLSITTASDSHFSASTSTSSAYLEHFDASLDFETMPPTTRRASLLSAEPIILDADEQPSKRQRTASTHPARAPKKEPRFQPTTTPRAAFDPFIDSDEEDEDKPLMIDLTEPSVAEEKLPSEPQEDTRVKLGAFQCVICMDNVENLTLTHCGMSFARALTLTA